MSLRLIPFHLIGAKDFEDGYNACPHVQAPGLKVSLLTQYVYGYQSPSFMTTYCNYMHVVSLQLTVYMYCMQLTLTSNTSCKNHWVGKFGPYDCQYWSL